MQTKYTVRGGDSHAAAPFGNHQLLTRDSIINKPENRNPSKLSVFQNQFLSSCGSPAASSWLACLGFFFSLTHKPAILSQSLERCLCNCCMKKRPAAHGLYG